MLRPVVLSCKPVSPRRPTAAPFSLMVLALILMSSPVEAEPALVANLPMVCFPPNAGVAPPCVVPDGIDPSMVSPDPSGSLRLRVRQNDTVTAVIRLRGIAPNLVLTARLIYFPLVLPPPHPIFEPISEGQPPIAASSIPLAPTWARYSEGLGWEPNEIPIRPNGRGFLRVDLDYNPLKANQGPLMNGMVKPNQSLAPPGFEAEQGICCLGRGGVIQPVGASLLRKFDPETGFQRIGENGQAELVRSPIPAAAVAVIAHLDGLPHGLDPGIPIPPLPGFPVSFGDHYVVGLFPLVPLHMD